MTRATPSDDEDLPAHRSAWKDGVAAQSPQRFPALGEYLSVDVVIVGGGITGLTTAARLAEKGRRVVLLEARTVGGGTSGHSTGNLYAPVDERLHLLAEKWDAGTVKAVVRSRLQAVDAVESFAKRFRLDCGFTRRPWTLYTSDSDTESIEQVEAEYRAALAAGLDARLSLDLPLPCVVRKALVVPGQAQFNPWRYVHRLAEAVDCSQCRIFEQSPVVAVDEKACEVRTASHVVRADHIVLATHTPKGFHLMQTELAPYREYAVAGRQGGHALPGGIFWSTGQHRTSVRSLEIGGKPYVMMVGEKHKTGQGDEQAACNRLSTALSEQFMVDDVEYRWSAQQYRSADGLPYIGSTHAASNLYVATGFASDGLTYGTLAGMMIADEICGERNEFSELYSPRRFTPLKSAKNFVKENINVAGRYLKDYTQSPLKKLNELASGEGALVEVNGERLAAFRDDGGRLHLLSSLCTHLRCVVQWNGNERSWDCPCHGSRFDCEGKVIEGPALAPLQSVTFAGDAGKT